jgi:hypothetical protein
LPGSARNSRRCLVRSLGRLLRRSPVSQQFCGRSCENLGNAIVTKARKGGTRLPARSVWRCYCICMHDFRFLYWIQDGLFERLGDAVQLNTTRRFAPSPHCFEIERSYQDCPHAIACNFSTMKCCESTQSLSTANSSAEPSKKLRTLRTPICQNTSVIGNS